MDNIPDNYDQFVIYDAKMEKLAREAEIEADEANCEDSYYQESKGDRKCQKMRQA